MFDFATNKLNSIDFLQDLSNEINKIEEFNNVSDALKIYIGLKKYLRESGQQINQELSIEYDKLLNKLKYITFINLSEEEIIELFSKYLATGIKMDYIDLLEVLKIKISLIPLLNRDTFKSELKKIIENNNEYLTNNKINTNNKEWEPTISTWLKNYNNYLGSGPQSNLEQNRYFVENKNFVHLTEVEKLWVKELLRIYEYLKRSSLSIDGNEDSFLMTDDDGRMYVLSEGIISNFLTREKSDKNILSPKDLKKMLTQYPPNSLERKAIEEEIKKMNTES